MIEREDEIEQDDNVMREAYQKRSVFLSEIDHELRTPMNIVMNLVEITLMRGDLPEEVRDNLRDILDSFEYIKILLNDAQDFHLMEQGQMIFRYEPVTMDSIAMYIKRTIGLMAEKKAIVFHVDTEQCVKQPLMLDRMRVQQIMLNLLLNSLKYTHEGGRIELIIKSRNADPDTIPVEIIVRDNGIGIRPEFCSVMYEPFARDVHGEDGYPEGLGLGLPITKMLVEQMKGTIQMTSQVNRGTEFVVQLSFGLAEPSTGSGASVTDGLCEHKTRHVLLCEDNRLNAKTLRTILETLSCKVDIVGNGQEAVDLFRQSEPHTYDLILMDIRMPVMDGREAAAHIRDMNRTDAKTVPMIAMTAGDSQSGKKELEDAGFTDYLIKPVNTEQLKQILEKL